LGEYSAVITYTGGSHANLTPEYAAIPAEMRAVAGFFGKNYLRETDESAFYSAIDELRGKVGGRAILRAAHFFDENRRVDAAAAALSRGDFPSFFAAVNASGNSSWRLLQNCYPAADTVQGIPLALLLSKRLIKDGAARVHGGGFAGTVLAFAKGEELASYVAEMRKVFGAGNVYVTSVRQTGAAFVK
jgi:galactokinase